MNFANKISTFRILSVPFFIASLVYYTPESDYLRFVALGIFSLAVISDAVDGYIARRSKQLSKAGLVLDPLADKALLLSAFVCLHLVEGLPSGIRFPLWVILIVISRDVVLIFGSAVIYVVKQKIDIRPTRLGKVTTILQMITVISLLLQLDFSFIFWWIASLLTVASGFDYVRKGLNTLYAPDNHRNNS
ncbi:CDP-alcohol phosphatidyltransferase family protein [Candidatus Omnitrophota bacterium]